MISRLFRPRSFAVLAPLAALASLVVFVSPATASITAFNQVHAHVASCDATCYQVVAGSTSASSGTLLMLAVDNKAGDGNNASAPSLSVHSGAPSATISTQSQVDYDTSGTVRGEVTIFKIVLTSAGTPSFDLSFGSAQKQQALDYSLDEFDGANGTIYTTGCVANTWLTAGSPQSVTGCGPFGASATYSYLVHQANESASLSNYNVAPTVLTNISGANNSSLAVALRGDGGGWDWSWATTSGVSGAFASFGIGY